MITQPWSATKQLSREVLAISDQGVTPPSRIIYHYTSVETAILIIAGQTLRFSHPTSFNDPLDLFDGLIDYRGTAQQIDSWVDKYPHDQERERIRRMMRLEPSSAELTFRESISRTKEKLGICCFSELPEQVLMWSHYAQKHKGVCLGFSLHPKQSIFSDDDFSLYQVSYPHQVETMTYFNDMDDVIKHWVATKSPCWSYEKENRAIINNMPASPDVRFDKACLKAIYFGCRTTATQRSSLTELLKANGFALDTWQQMKIDDATFSVKAVPYEVSTS